MVQRSPISSSLFIADGVLGSSLPDVRDRSKNESTTDSAGDKELGETAVRRWWQGEARGGLSWMLFNKTRPLPRFPLFGTEG